MALIGFARWASWPPSSRFATRGSIIAPATPDLADPIPTCSFISKNRSLHLQQINSVISPLDRTALQVMSEPTLVPALPKATPAVPVFHSRCFQTPDSVRSLPREVGNFTDRSMDPTFGLGIAITAPTNICVARRSSKVSLDRTSMPQPGVVLSIISLSQRRGNITFRSTWRSTSPAIALAREHRNLAAWPWPRRRRERWHSNRL